MNNLQSLIQSFIATLTTFVTNSLPTVAATANDYIAATQSRLATLYKYYTHEDPQERISKKFLLERLAEEKDIMISQLASFGVIGGQLVQDTVNNAIKLVTDFIEQTSNENNPS